MSKEDIAVVEFRRKGTGNNQNVAVLFVGLATGEEYEFHYQTLAFILSNTELECVIDRATDQLADFDSEDRPPAYIEIVARLSAILMHRRLDIDRHPDSST